MMSGDDDEMERLQQAIADLKRQNAILRGMLTDAINLAGAAIKLDAAAEDVGESAPDGDGAWEDQGEGTVPSFKSLFNRG